VSIKLRVNQNSLSKKLQQLETHGEEFIKGALEEISGFMVVRTPVDTGAFAESYSVRLPTDSSGRRVSSANRPRKQNPETFQNVARQNMFSDIEVLDLENHSSVLISNRAPHAGEVENRHQIFNSARDRFR